MTMRRNFTGALVVAALVASTAAAATKIAKPKNRVMNCPIDAATLDDCDTEAYLLSIGMYLAAPALLGLLIMLFCPFYFCGRFVCNCCGGRMPTRGCCCACGQEEPAYSVGERFRPKVYATLLLIAAIVATPWALAGATELTGGLYGFIDDIKAVPDVLRGLLGQIESTLTTYRYDFEEDVVIEINLYLEGGLDVEGEKVVAEVDDLIQDSLGAWNSYVENASTFMFVMSVVPFVCLVIGTLAGWCNIRHCIPTLLLIVMFLLFTPLTWITHGISGLGGVLFGDICAEIHGIAAREQNVGSALMNCKDSQFDTFNEKFGLLETAQSLAACLLLKAGCYNNSDTADNNAYSGKIFNCPATFECDQDTVSFASVLKVMETSTIHSSIFTHPNATKDGYTCVATGRIASTPCLIEECADLCTTPDQVRSINGKFSRGIVVHTEAAGRVATSKDTIAAQFASCESMPALILGPFDANCQRITNGFVALHNAFGLSAITTVGFLFVMVWGSKRFVSGKSEEELLDEEIAGNGPQGPDGKA